MGCAQHKQKKAVDFPFWDLLVATVPPNVHPRFEEFLTAASPKHQNADGCNLLVVYLRYS